jgi:hypothetical protein
VARYLVGLDLSAGSFPEGNAAIPLGVSLQTRILDWLRQDFYGTAECRSDPALECDQLDQI